MKVNSICVLNSFLLSSFYTLLLYSSLFYSVLSTDPPTTPTNIFKSSANLKEKKISDLASFSNYHPIPLLFSFKYHHSTDPIYDKDILFQLHLTGKVSSLQWKSFSSLCNTIFLVFILPHSPGFPCTLWPLVLCLQCGLLYGNVPWDPP